MKQRIFFAGDTQADLGRQGGVLRQFAEFVDWPMSDDGDAAKS